MDRLSVMETFVRVVEMGSISAAARHMNVGQPAVSKSVALLEKRLGVRLLIRSTRGLRPTEAGQTYVECARRALLVAEEAERAACGVDARMGGRLRIGASVAFGNLYLMPHLPAFLAAHPELSIDLVLEDRPVDLLEEGIDLALRSGPLCDSALVGRKIATSERLVLGTPDYFCRLSVPETPDDLIKHDAVIYTLDPCGSDSWVFRKEGGETLVKLRGRLQVTASEAVRTSVLSGMGLAIAPRWMFDSELASGAVCPVLTDWALPESDIWVLFSAGRLANAKTRAFVKFVESVLSASLQLGLNAAKLRCPQDFPAVA